MSEWQVVNGDCVEAMRGMPDCSVDAVVCDPPYELSFMSKSWDGTGIAYSVEMWGEVLRVLKPGGHLLAFGGTRTFHRMTVAIEDAGFEVRDCLSWLYGSGFPKSLNVGKAIDKAAGAKREVVGEGPYSARRPRQEVASVNAYADGVGDYGSSLVTAPATEEAARWEGWGTALKPAWEPVVLARKPLVGTVAANVLAYGTGALNIDGSRIGTPSEVKPQVRPTTDKSGASWSKGDHTPFHYPPDGGGRWPANVLLDEVAAGMLDQQSGNLKSGNLNAGHKQGSGRTSFQGMNEGNRILRDYGGDKGGASRFFYVAKASRRDRNEGLDGMPERKAGSMSGAETRPDRPTNHPMRANHHPTVKPTALMRHLVRLVTPPDGLVLDPFCGSGSTGKAAVLEGFRFVGIEQDADYAEIARRRIGWAAEQAAEERDQPTLL